MRLGKFFGLASCFLQFLIFLVPSQGVASEEELFSEPLHLMESYIDRVLGEAKQYHPEWAEDLIAEEPTTKIQGIRRHAGPFDERWLKDRKRSWLFFWRNTPSVPRPSRRHLNTVETIANEIRTELCLQQTCGGNRYPWTEQNIFEFEKVVFGKLSDAVAEFDLKIQTFHEDRRPPSDFEFEKLLQEYLEIWTLGALLEIESEKFLSAFPLSTPHREGVNTRRMPYSDKIGDCRVALIRMSNSSYRW
jgi:hypothetical protein